ncbi:uncharacterized protein [Argopecten irradians]|uniref:uncharacterized protein n=1 Tax=Argopecten irradians TaxID=31199 RepID=UPI0037206D00
MGNKPSKPDKLNGEGKENDKSSQRKAFVIIKPWTNEERNEGFPKITIDQGEEVVSTTFNIEVREVKDSSTEEKSRQTTQTDTTPSDIVQFKYNSKQLDEVTYIYPTIDSASENGQTKDFIKLSMKVQIVKNLVIYTLHQYNGNEWIKTEIEQKVGQATVEVNMCEIVTTETIFFTMRYISEEITIPPQGYEYANEYCRNQRVIFPKGAVGDNEKLSITTISLEDEYKRKRLKKQMGSLSSITGVSNIVHVPHTKSFGRKITVRLEVDPVINIDGSTTTHLFECDDDGNVRVKLGVKIKQVPTEDVTGNNVYEVQMDTLNRVGIFIAPPTENHSTNSKSLMTTFGLGKDQCRILTFLSGGGPEKHLWVDVVPERKWEKRNKELRERENHFELLDTVSPSVPMGNRSKTKIILPESSLISTDVTVPIDSLVVYYDQSASEIYNHFPIVKNQKARSDMTTVQYHIGDYVVHTAYFKLTPDQMPVPVIQNKEIFTDRSMSVLAREMTVLKTTELMLVLGLRLNKITTFREKYNDNFTSKLALLNFWSQEIERSSPRTKITILCKALRDVEQTIFAEVLETVYQEGRELRTEDFEN